MLHCIVLTEPACPYTRLAGRHAVIPIKSMPVSVGALLLADEVDEL